MLFSTDMTKLVSTRQQLEAQLNENKVVQEVKPALSNYTFCISFKENKQSFALKVKQ